MKCEYIYYDLLNNSTCLEVIQEELLYNPNKTKHQKKSAHSTEYSVYANWTAYRQIPNINLLYSITSGGHFKLIIE